jgi:carboxyl-terminal processing protease
LQEHLPRVNRDKLQSFRTELSDTWLTSPVGSTLDARTHLQKIAQAAQKTLGLKPPVAVFEFVCGACNALDEYTAFLTAAQVQEETTLPGSELVGVGLDLQVRNQKLVIGMVTPDSPAAMAGLKKTDVIVRIDRKRTDSLSADVAEALLRGEPGTFVELEVQSPGELPRTLKLARQAVFMPSVLDIRFLDPDMTVGYIRLIGFQKTTIQELEDAILRLQTEGMRTLVLDLRGNPGGMFKVAVQVAERFLAEGVIVSTYGQLRDYNRTYEAHSGASALDMPLVLLVDGDTASAAEVVAGALKDNQRATLVGQTTYGKGSVQFILKLSAAAGGLRVTLAKFCSPRGQAYSGTGITPHIVVEPAPLDMMMMSEGPLTDRQLEYAVREASRLLSMRQ